MKEKDKRRYILQVGIKNALLYITLSHSLENISN